GLGDKTDRDKFTQISSLKDKKIVAISAGYDNSLALTSDGKVYAAGNNQYGQLGLGDNTDRDAFTEVASLNGKNIVAITAGGSSFAIAKDGKVYATGWNKNGGINMGKQKEEHKIFIEVKDLSGKHISAVAIGESHILALDKEGKVYGAGLSQYGQLGLGAYEEKARATFTEITDLSDKNIVAVSAGNTRSFALAKNGKIYAAGNNKYGGLGLGDSGEETSRDIFEEALSLNDKNIIAIATGFWHTLALGKDGKVYGAGHNNSGQLALGDNTDRDIFTLIPTK
ncbi:MAG: hypothetical protein LBC09_03875, partial [Helicobacteraceae bacterium]|nr:hypothetical protein [Helicobacteraceae bacterium]